MNEKQLNMIKEFFKEELSPAEWYEEPLMNIRDFKNDCWGTMVLSRNEEDDTEYVVYKDGSLEERPWRPPSQLGIHVPNRRVYTLIDNKVVFSHVY